MIVKHSVHPTLQQVFRGGIWQNFVAAMDIELNVEESREITTLNRMGHHWSASYHYCQSLPYRSEPLLDKDKGNPYECDHHGEITEDNSNEYATYISDPLSTTMHQKA